MKKIDDEKIVNKFNETKDYKIKTSSQEILNIFKAEQTETIKETKKEKPVKKKFIFGGIGASLVAVGACSIALVFLFNNGEEPSDIIVPPNLQQISSTNVLGNELLTLSSFKTYGETSVNRSFNFIKKRASLKESDFERIVDDYDSIQNGALNILNKEDSVKVEIQKEVNFTYEGKTYKYCDNYYSYEDDFKDPFMSFYYSEMDEDQFGQNFESETEYLVNLNNSYYDCYIAKESEAEEDEKEEEIKILCVNEKDSEYILIEKESEYEGREVENSYSISYFSSLNDFDDDNFDYTLTYDLEKEGNNEELEISVETPYSQTEFQNISLKNNDPLTYEFLVEYENERDYIEIENLPVTLTYENDQRIYTSRGYDYSITRK